MPQPFTDITPAPPENDVSKSDNSADVEEVGPPPEKYSPPWSKRLRRWYKSHKKISLSAALLIIIVVLTAVPFSRYNLSALVLKNNFSIKVLDATTKLPVSGATVQAGKISVQTDASGQAKLHLPVGQRTIKISKSYYRAGTFNGLVPILSQNNMPVFSLQATGRQVKISVKNLINKSNLAGVDIEVAGISAATDASGSALLVLPPAVAQQSASLSLNGYNDAKVTIKVSDQNIQQNDLYMTPAGKLYYLADKSGKLELMKSNLDGTAPEVVIAGTGNEDIKNTYFSHSVDWKYLALIAKRDSGPAKLYVINTADDQLLTMDQGRVNFSPVGWDKDVFIYKVDQSQAVAGKYDQVTLKSYDAQIGRLVSIDQTTTQAINSNTFLQSTISNTYIVDDNLFYTKFWDRFGYYDPTTDLAGKTEYFYKVNPNGSGRQTLRSIKATDYQWVFGKLTKPDTIFYQLGGFDASGKRKNYVYYVYSNGQLAEDKTAAEADFNKAYPAYFVSPSGDKYLWSQQAGSQDIFIGGASAANPQKLNVPKNYTAAGWYGDKYLLLTKDSSQLYIMGVGGGAPTKVTDYQAGGVY